MNHLFFGIISLVIWCQFHQHFTYNFYARRCQKRKKIQLSHKYLFTLSGSASVKAVCRTLMKLSPSNFFRYIDTVELLKSGIKSGILNKQEIGHLLTQLVSILIVILLTTTDKKARPFYS
jgi:hypothetical protein